MKIETPAEQVLYSTVRIETQGSKPDEIGAGTSFIFGVRLDGQTFPCLVTNKHVVKGARVGRFFFTRRKGDGPDIGKRMDIEMDDFEGRWYGHPDPEIDIAVMPVGLVLNAIKKTGDDVFIKSFDQSTLPSAEQVEELDALEEVVFVGYPSGIYDSANLLPVFRRGITATPLQIDHNGRPIFLVDASVFPGSSGSPVLIYNLGGYGGRKGFTVATRFFLLGIMAQVAFREEKGTLEFEAIPTAQRPVVKTKQMIDLGVVFKASAIVDTIQSFLSMSEGKGGA